MMGLLEINDFKEKYNIEYTKRQYSNVTEAIPDALLHMIKSHLQYLA